MKLEGKLTLDNGETVEFFINEDGAISRWGNTTAVLGSVVDVTEMFANAMRKESGR